MNDEGWEDMGIEKPDMSEPMYRLQPVPMFPGLFRASRPGYPRKIVPETDLVESMLAFKEDGITDIVCLLTDGEYFKFYGLDLVDFYRHHGVSGFAVHRFPIPDFGVPRVEFAYQMARTMDDLLRAKKKVLVHCSAGHGRTGLAINCLIEWVNFRDKKKLKKGDMDTGGQMSFLAQLRYHLKRMHSKGKKKGKRSGKK